MRVSRELSKCMLYLVEAQEVRLGGGGTEVTGENKIFYVKGNGNHKLGTIFFYLRKHISSLGGLSLLQTICHT
jgi:hypothetical protein